MGPQDLMCRWCSTFVGQGRKFCSIFCESRYTRSKRRKLAFRRPSDSSSPPTTSKSVPTKKSQFLEEVVTAIENDKPSPERDKRQEQDTSRSSETTPESKIPVPKLDLSAIKEAKDDKRKIEITSKYQSRQTSSKKTEETNSKSSEEVMRGSSDKENEKGKPNIRHKSAALRATIVDKKSKLGKGAEVEAATDKANGEFKSKTQTINVHKQGSKIPVRAKAEIKVDNSDDVKAVADLDKKKIGTNDASVTATRLQTLSYLNERLKGDSELGILTEANERRKTRTALEYEKRVRSSGYGSTGNPNVRPARSATGMSSAIRQQRQRSAISTKSSTMDKSYPDGLKDERSNLLAKTNAKPFEVKSGNAWLESVELNPNSMSKRGEVTHRTELTKINEIVREESANSEIPDQSELQIRLSSIKRKVEVRKRRGDSRSSFGSDLDTSFKDSTQNQAFSRESLPGSSRMLETSRSPRQSTRNNITQISKQFQTRKNP